MLRIMIIINSFGVLLLGPKSICHALIFHFIGPALAKLEMFSDKHGKIKIDIYFILLSPANALSASNSTVNSLVSKEYPASQKSYRM